MNIYIIVTATDFSVKSGIFCSEQERYTLTLSFIHLSALHLHTNVFETVLSILLWAIFDFMI